MEYQNIINFLYNTSNQLSKFRKKNWIEINDQSRGVYNTSSHIRYKTTMLKSSLCDYSNVQILVKGTIEQLLEQEMKLQKHKEMIEIKL